MWQKDGFAPEGADLGGSLEELRGLVKNLPAIFQRFSTHQRLDFPAPGKWSRQQLLGHLVDSALYNLQRLTLAQAQPGPFRVNRYPQEELVKINQYQLCNPEEILGLWTALNRQLIWVVENLAPEQASVVVETGYENLSPRTLAWLFCDYVAHLQHHYRQMLREQ